MWIQVYHNAEGKEEFGEKPFLQVPKKGFCQFMQTTYKDRLYSLIKDHSNFPKPEDCPVKAVIFLCICFEFYKSLSFLYA